LSLTVTVCDKLAAKVTPRHRAREMTLLILAAAGGSAVMLMTMLVIRHKTRHVKFMLGIPIIIMLQFAAAWALIGLGVISL
jgi:uncharacterized membrane protein YsdA (DUF1294 family)